MHVALAVSDVERAYAFYREIFGWESHLECAGARRLSPRQQRGWGDEAAYFADPDGNVFAVAARLAQ
jgi:catechol-2,3-dioxygenase